MGRPRIEIKKIQDGRKRWATLFRRRSGLFKMAHELSVLCDAQVAVMVFTDANRLYEFSTSSMSSLMERYRMATEASTSRPIQVEHNEVSMSSLMERYRMATEASTSRPIQVEHNEVSNMRVLMEMAGEPHTPQLIKEPSTSQLLVAEDDKLDLELRLTCGEVTQKKN